MQLDTHHTCTIMASLNNIPQWRCQEIVKYIPTASDVIYINQMCKLKDTHKTIGSYHKINIYNKRSDIYFLVIDISFQHLKLP